MVSKQVFPVFQSDLCLPLYNISLSNLIVKVTINTAKLSTVKCFQMSVGKLAKVFMDFCQDSTIHGLSKVADSSQTKAARITWFITIILSIFCATYIIYESFKGKPLQNSYHSFYSTKAEWHWMAVNPSQPTQVEFISLYF